MSEPEGGVRTVYRIELWRDGLCREAEVFLGEPRHTCLAGHRDNTGTVPMHVLIEACVNAVIGHYEQKDPPA